MDRLPDLAETTSRIRSGIMKSGSRRAGITRLTSRLCKYMHASEVYSGLGSGMGGITGLQRMFKDRRE